MAKKSLKVKQQKEQKYKTREYNRCKFVEDHMLILESLEFARVCFRELAHKGEIPGVKKASW